jgi:hypothetical protein
MDGYPVTTRRIDAELGLLVPPDALDWCEVRCETISGVPHEAIPGRATALGADLIVMGLPERAPLERLIEGSTARGVLRRAVCPVLMVPGPPGLTAGISETIVPLLAAGAWPLLAERRASVHAPPRVLQERHEVAELMRRELLPVSARHQGDGARLHVGD